MPVTHANQKGGANARASTSLKNTQNFGLNLQFRKKRIQKGQQKDKKQYLAKPSSWAQKARQSSWVYSVNSQQNAKGKEHQQQIGPLQTDSTKVAPNVKIEFKVINDG